MYLHKTKEERDSLVNSIASVVAGQPIYSHTAQRARAIAAKLEDEGFVEPGLAGIKVYEAIAAAIQAAEEPWRKLLWSNHARYLPYQHFLYGDDGEMQCCGIDFKRDSTEQIEKHLEKRISALAAQPAKENK